MNSNPSDLQKGPTALVSTLLETLQEEFESLVRLYGHFDLQIEAIRRRSRSLIDDTTQETNEEINVLARLKQTRERQLRLLGRVLKIDSEHVSIREIGERLATSAETRDVAGKLLELQAKARQQAVHTQRRCRDLEFSLQYAVHLGRELLHAIQGIDPHAGGRTYTAQGGAVESTGTRSFLNKVG